MIRQNASLKSRIEALEQRKYRRLAPRIVWCLQGADEAGVIGYEASGVVIMRLPDEPVADCLDRAFTLSDAVTLTTLYCEQARQSAAEHQNDAAPTQTAPDAPTASDGPSEPWPAEPIAGIGRVASRADLIKAGAIRHLPPERII